MRDKEALGKWNESLFETAGIAEDPSGYLGIVGKVRDAWTKRRVQPTLWFRGHPHIKQELEPTLLRRCERYYKDLERYEDYFEIEFKARARGLMTKGMEPRWLLEWCYLQRHHTLPTRLLDWTESSLVALYFAAPPTSNPFDGCVWVLNVDWLAKYSIGRHNPKKRLEAVAKRVIPNCLPIPTRPTVVDPRIVVQRSCFTMHSIKRGGFLRMHRHHDGGDKALQKIVIPGGKKAEIRQELRRAGISEATLFPDLDGLARDLSNSEPSDARVNVIDYLDE